VEATPAFGEWISNARPTVFSAQKALGGSGGRVFRRIDLEVCPGA
jgi:hypothetical protein